MFSSAKLHTSDFFMEKNKSLINMLNKKGPRIDSCSAPVLISYQEFNDKANLV